MPHRRRSRIRRKARPVVRRHSSDEQQPAPPLTQSTPPTHDLAHLSQMPSAARTHSVHSLQRRHGHRAVQRILAENTVQRTNGVDGGAVAPALPTVHYDGMESDDDDDEMVEIGGADLDAASGHDTVSDDDALPMPARRGWGQAATPLGPRGAPAIGTGRDTAPPLVAPGALPLPPAADDRQTISNWDDLIDTSSIGTGMMAAILRKLLGRDRGTEITSTDLSLMMGIGGAIGIPGFTGVSLIPRVTVSGSVNTQDDQQLRAGLKFTFGVDGAVGDPKVFEAVASADGSAGVTKVFPNEEALAAYVIFRTKKLFATFGQLASTSGSVVSQFVEEHLKEDSNRRAYMEWLHGKLDALGVRMAMPKLEQKPGTVKTFGVGGGVGMSGRDGAVAAGVGASYTQSAFTKYKKDRHGNFVKYVKGKNAETISLSGEVSSSISPPGMAGFGVKIAGAFTSISGHANPDNDGQYLNVKVSFEGLAGSVVGQIFKLVTGANQLDKIQRLLADHSLKNILKQGKTLLNDVLNGILHLINNGIIEASSQLAAMLDNDTVSLSVSESAAVEMNFVIPEKVPRLQYIRTSGASAIDFSAKADIPVGEEGETLALRGAASASRTRSYGEKLGANTMTYLHTVYNGLRKGGRPGAARWQEWRDHHGLSIRQMLLYMAHQRSHIRSEVNGAGVAQGTNLLAAATAFRKREMSYSNVMPVLEAFLEAVYQKTAAAANEGWVKATQNRAFVVVDATDLQSPKIFLQNYVNREGARAAGRDKPTTIAGALNAENTVVLSLIVQTHERSGLKGKKKPQHHKLNYDIVSGGRDIAEELKLDLPLFSRMAHQQPAAAATDADRSLKARMAGKAKGMAYGAINEIIGAAGEERSAAGLHVIAQLVAAIYNADWQENENPPVPDVATGNVRRAGHTPEDLKGMFNL